MRLRLALVTAAALLAGVGGCADPRFGAVLEPVLGAGGVGGPDRETVAAGLREALRLGSERAVETVSQPGGYLGDPALRIGLPEELRSTADTLRRFGLGSQVESLELAMNRAAEDAAGEALPVLVDAVRSMTLEDVMGLWRGGDTAATDFFRARTSDALRARFAPIVERSMDQVGLVRAWRTVSASARALPGVELPAVDLSAWVTGRTLDGLFTALGREEARIREDPAARTTELLREVFGRV